MDIKEFNYVQKRVKIWDKNNESLLGVRGDKSPTTIEYSITDKGVYVTRISGIWPTYTTLMGILSNDRHVRHKINDCTYRKILDSRYFTIRRNRGYLELNTWIRTNKDDIIKNEITEKILPANSTWKVDIDDVTFIPFIFIHTACAIAYEQYTKYENDEELVSFREYFARNNVKRSLRLNGVSMKYVRSSLDNLNKLKLDGGILINKSELNRMRF